MADTFLFELVSPERLLLSQQVKEVLLPGSEGYLTVLAHHAPLITTIIPGIVRVKTENEEIAFVVVGGFVDISEEGCSLLAEQARPLGDGNLNEMQSRIDSLRSSLTGARGDENHNELEDFLHQFTTVEGVATQA